MYDDLPAILTLGFATLLILAMGEGFYRLLGVSPDTTRKISHIGSGATVVAFRYWFHSPGSVAVVCLAFGVLLTVARRLGMLRSIHGVSRPGIGAVGYPIGVFATALLTWETPRLYVIAILLLALGDGLGGLIGDRYGKHRYDIGGHQRSVEGSSAVFLVSWLVVTVGLWEGGMETTMAVLTGAVLGAITTAVEGLSPWGSDNMTIPVVASLYLTALLPHPEQIFHHAAVALATLAIVAISLVRRSLTVSGGLAAFLMGLTMGAADWSWFAALITMFLGINLASKVGKGHKPLQGKGSQRDHVQVVANVGVGALCALGSTWVESPIWLWGCLGALGTAGADTLASELGVLWGAKPVSITTFQPVPRGVSGGVSLPGYAAAVLGGGLVAAGWWMGGGVGWTPMLAAMVGGIVGCTFDSLLGALVQVRYRCGTCDTVVEDASHCGQAAGWTRGIRWMDNDMVNLWGSGAGAITGMILWAIL